ncbi:MAG TPA: GNAT family N-acetyltransferase [Acidimicrobiia bacterium]|nr:GNAT family N-acetyltransferase [Acidimicrobiia bacterium]
MSDEVRRAVSEDADALADVHVTTWQTAYRGIFPDEFLDGLDREARRRWWRARVEEDTPVAVVGRPAIGFCLVGDADEEGLGEVFAIYVHPDHWRRGHGHRLLRAGSDVLRDMGHERALLWVLRDNDRARRFYESQGWELGKPIRVEEIGGAQVTEVRYETDL